MQEREGGIREERETDKGERGERKREWTEKKRKIIDSFGHLFREL